MINYRKLLLVRVVESYFDEPPATRADIVRHYWRSAPLGGAGWTEAPTLVLNLDNNPDTLLAEMHHNTRYAIRRAAKDDFQYTFWNTHEPEALAGFCRFYDEVAAVTHLVPANRQRLTALSRLGVLDLSRVSDKSGEVLVWHAYYRTPDRARLTHSASRLGQTSDPSLRALIGRANAYHTWRDILRFQQSGLSVYDLGGWYTGTTDEKKLGINRFKESFGGVLIKQFNFEAGATPAGRMALSWKQWMLNCLSWSRSRKLLQRLQSHTASPLR